MKKRKINIKKFKPSRRKTFRVLGIFFFTLLFLHISLYFGSDLLLRNYLQREVERLSAGKYAIDFDRFNLSILERGFYVQGFILLPMEEAFDEDEEKPLYRISIPKITVKNLGYNFSEHILTIGNLRFTQPGIQSKQDQMLLEKQQVSPLELLEMEVRKSIGPGLQNVVIENLNIDDADLLLENFISQKSIAADNANLYVKHIELLSRKENASPFNARGFTLDLQNFKIILGDSVHTVRSSSVSISSIDQYIRAEKVNISPDLTRAAEDYYEINLDNLELLEADIDRMFYTSDVNVGALKLKQPRFSHYSGISEKASADTLQGLYPLIKDVLASISIEDLTIIDGQYLHSRISEPDKKLVEADGINFTMDQVYIGPDQDRVKDQFFYAQDATLDISMVRVALADGVHWISGEQVSLSSFEDQVAMEKVQVIPIYEGAEKPDITLFEIEVPKVILGNANLKRIYNERILDIDEIIFSSPSVLLKDLAPDQGFSGKVTIQDLTQDYLKAIYIKKLSVTDGSLTLDNDLRIRQDSLSFGKISFVLEDFRLDEQTETEESSRIFLAEDLWLEIEDYALKLSDNLHLFTARKMLFDTKENFLAMEGFRLSPQSNENIQSTLNRYSKSTVLDIDVPYFYAYGVDISEAIFHEKLLVEEIKVPSPIIKLQIHNNANDDGDENKMDRLDLVNLLTSYFSVVKVNAVNVVKGTLELENFGRDKIQTFAENDVNIGVKNFYVDKNIDPTDSRVLFAEELDILLNNYVFNIAEGKYRIVADGISFNSAREEISTTNVRLRPSLTLDSKAVIQADIPSMSLKGVDLEAFLFENTFALSKLKLSGADVQLYLNRGKAEEANPAGTSRRRERNLPKTIDIIRIDTVEAEDAKFNLAYREGVQDLELINSGVNMSFYDFLLDSAKLVEGDLASFFSSMSMEMDQFSLSLKDSIHTINFSKVGFDSKSGEIVFDDFSVVPGDFTGTKGFPVIEARIPKVSISTSSLMRVQSTGDFIVKDLLLSRPEITLYLDKEDVEKAQQDKEALAQKVIERLSIQNFEIRKGLLTLREKISGKKINTFKNLSITLQDLDFDLTSTQSINKNFYLNKDFQFELTDYEVKLPDSLNLLRIGRVLLSEDRLQLKDVSLIPRYGVFEYHRRVGFETDVANVHIPEVVVSGLSVEKLIGEKLLEASSVSLNNARIDIFRDKRFDIQSTEEKQMPQNLMLNGVFEVKLDSLIIKNADVIYREFPEKGLVPGVLTFNNLNAAFLPFYISKNPGEFPLSSSTLAADGLINGEAPINLKGELYYQAPYPIHLVAEVGEFELSVLNSIIETNAFASILDGTVKGASSDFTLDDDAARGSITIRYNDLKLMLLEERTLRRGRGKKSILTFVINNLAVRSNNPRKLFNRLVSSPIYLKRDKNRFVFNYLWKATVSGIQGSVGLGKPKEEKKP